MPPTALRYVQANTLSPHQYRHAHQISGFRPFDSLFMFAYFETRRWLAVPPVSPRSNGRTAV